ncbi:hypothetical protein KFE25_011399 [Diacronema lutheri]|uniref:SAM-dependent MTase RsmB/NOP-type domain-containing protein n=1 Tax=Diacronema lutheri TaxID=2081491 RepID=A0A8J5XGX2_DIALT|nr:hypothetical protein KFE25_011399 [Diacronema lutheri]
MGGGAKGRHHKRRRVVEEVDGVGAASGAAAVESAAGEEVDERPAYQRPGESEQGLAFERYYRAQRILPAGSNDDDGAWAAFFAHLRRPLPVTFRLNESTHLRALCREAMETGARLLEPAAAGAPVPCDAESGRPLRMATRLGWCNGWQLGCSAGVLKRPHHAHWAELNDWLTRWAALGVVSRQAIDSMAPVALLRVQPHHAVLDLCASPGSKTQQLLDAMHALPGTPPTGFVVANDMSAFRARALVRRCAALGGGACRVAVTSHAAQRFPDVGGRVALRGEGMYDRIVCDVPCCGDGTFRKNPEAWNHWRPSFALRLHGLQLSIALRGLALLAIGGELAYSTCALNPVEDEAVVAELIRRTGGAVELVDVSDRLPLLRRAAGLRTWRVIDDDGREWPSYEAVLDAQLPHRVRRRFHASMWPPRAGAQRPRRQRPPPTPPSPPPPPPPPLERCVRLLPGLSESGGFFVALLRKVRPWPPPTASPERAPMRAPAAPEPARRAYAPAPAPLRALFRHTTGMLVPSSGALGGIELHCRDGAWAAAREGAAAPTRACLMALAPQLRAHLARRDDGLGAPVLRVVRAGAKVAHTTRSGSLRLSHAGAEAVVAASRANSSNASILARIASVQPEDMVALLRAAGAQPTLASAAMASAGGARRAAAAALTPLSELSAGARQALAQLGCGACIVNCAPRGLRGSGGADGGGGGAARSQPAAPKRARGRTRDCEERQLQAAVQQQQQQQQQVAAGGSYEGKHTPDDDGGIFVTAFVARLPDDGTRAARGLGVRVALTHEPGLENLPRAFAAHALAQLMSAP